MNKEKIYEILDKTYFSEQRDERECLDHLRRVLHGVHSFVDVGASLGQYTFEASRLLESAAILAIEADPVRHERLARNCSEWARTSGNTVNSILCALSDRGGTTTFWSTNSNVSGGLHKTSLSHLSEDQKAGVEWEGILVPSETLDRLFPDTVPDFVKMDIEGGELDALRGASRILGMGKTVFLIELHRFSGEGWGSDPEKVRKLMRRNGYTELDFFDKALFVRNVPIRYSGLLLRALARRALTRMRRAGRVCASRFAP